MGWPDRIARGIVGVVFALGALGKSLDPAALEPAYDALGMLFEARAPLTLALVAVEAGLGLSLILGVATAHARRLAIALLLVFTAVLAMLLNHPDRPPCGCFGALTPDGSAAASTLVGIGRNVCLLGLLLAASPRPASASSPSSLRRTQTTG